MGDFSTFGAGFTGIKQPQQRNDEPQDTIWGKFEGHTLDHDLVLLGLPPTGTKPQRDAIMDAFRAKAKELAGTGADMDALTTAKDRLLVAAERGYEPVNQLQDSYCKMCKGTGRMVGSFGACPSCKGTGQRS